MRRFACCKGGKRDCKLCIEDATDGKCAYPAPLLIFSTTKDDARPPIYRPGSISVSATQLSPCHRRTILKEYFEHDIDPQQYISMMFGSGWHRMMEQHWPHEVAPSTIERRLFRTINVGGIEVRIHGTPDIHDLEHEVIFDWKTTNKPMDCEASRFCFDGPGEEYTSQLNVYAWMVEDGEYEDGERIQGYVSRAFLNVLGKNGGMGKDANKWVTKTFPVPLWNWDVVERYIRDGVMPYVEFAKSRYARLPHILPDTKKGERHWMCRSCQVRELCDQIGDQEGTYLTYDDPTPLDRE